jgi:hypothetical protein
MGKYTQDGGWANGLELDGASFEDFVCILR